jgi:hypothetical protein
MQMIWNNFIPFFRSSTHGQNILAGETVTFWNHPGQVEFGPQPPEELWSYDGSISQYMPELFSKTDN